MTSTLGACLFTKSTHGNRADGHQTRRRLLADNPLLETIIKTMADHCGERVDITPDTRLRCVTIDSLDRFELTLELEEATGLCVEDEDFEASQTVNCLYVRLLQKREAA